MNLQIKSTMFAALFFSLYTMNITAAEESQLSFVPVSSIVKNVPDSHTFIVKTLGEQENEGFVYTPTQFEKGDQISFQINMKGSGEVFLKIEQSDAKGTFIKETTSSSKVLTNDWQTIKLNAGLSQNSQQIDVMVLTQSQMETNFSFKDIYLESTKIPQKQKTTN